MTRYIATFYTHLSALLSFQALQNADIPVRMLPVPRTLSSSCGTCVQFSAETDCRALLDTDTEAIYLAGTTGYILLWRSET